MISESRKQNQSGITLIEIVVVLSLLAIIGGFAAAASIGDLRGYLFNSDRNMAVNVLQKARSQAINNICLGAACMGGKSHGAHFAPGEYVIFQGSSYAARDAAVDEVIAINDPVQTSGISDVIFSQLSGQVATPGILTVFDSAGHSVNININAEGRIDW